MKLQPLTLEQCQQVRRWRNECRETLRTSHMISELEQEIFYDRISDPRSEHRYWAIMEEEQTNLKHGEVPMGIPKGMCLGFRGMGGLTNIQWENRNAEISLILDPKIRGKGYGEQAVDLLLEEAFHRMNLNCVYGECYFSNINGVIFWERIATNYGGSKVVLRSRKFWAGKYWQSLYFDILREEYETSRNNRPL